MESIIENNKLIAEFMGAVAIGAYENKEQGTTHIMEYPKTEKGIKYAPTNCLNHSTGAMHYHDDWNWLMGVINRIEDISDDLGQSRFNVQIEQCFCCILDQKTSEDICELDGDTKIEVTYNAVIEFIKFWNKNKDK